MAATDGFSPAEVEARTGYLHDFISGQQVKATPEEVDAVQVFSRRLVEDYGYHKEQIQTRPQFGVRRSPSDEKKSYPIDIAVFQDDKPKTEDNLFIIVECKKKTRKDSVNQLKIYMDLSAAHIGVWFNGEEHLYLRKLHLKDGGVAYKEMPAIPRRGQRMEDIGLYLRRDLKVPSNLKAVFRDLRHHLAGNTTGITRDETLAQEIINLLFCKIYDELNTGMDENVTFRAGLDEEPSDVKARIVSLFENKVKAEYADVFSDKDAITLDADSLVYVVGELQNYVITEADRDAVGDAFEVFIGPALRGGEGQFFTPRNVVKMMIDILNPRPGEMIIDPACGSGGFLIMALEYVWRQMDVEARQKGYKAETVIKKKQDIATRCFRGLDKDSFLAKVTKAYMAIIGDGRGGVFCENSLLPPTEWSHATQDKIKLSQFDVILTNPPFGADIRIEGAATLSQYQLGYRWKEDGAGFVKTNILKDKEAPQILFIERCIQLLKAGGRMAMVLPEGVYGNSQTGYIIDYLRAHGQIMAVIDCTRRLFQPSTDTKTNVLIFRKFAAGETAQPENILFSIVRTCGHDKRGRPIVRQDGSIDDEMSLVADALREAGSGKQSRFGFRQPLAQVKPYYIVPRYYNPEIAQTLAKMDTEGFILQSVEELRRGGILSISKGHEIGSDVYGTGNIPFIRTSDIANLEITHDPTFAVDVTIFNEYAPKQNLQPYDVLFVNDGRYRIGNVCILTEHDIRIIIQSHFRVLRVLKPEILDPFLLLYLLKHPAVREQVEAKTFIQSTIATIGSRLGELVLPIPKHPEAFHERVASLRHIILERARLRVEAHKWDKYEEDEDALS